MPTTVAATAAVPPRRRRRLVTAAVIDALEPRRLLAATFTVTNTNNAGAGSFRQALLNEESAAGEGASILFNIPGTGTRIITLTSPLPAITKQVTITGPLDSNNNPLVELTGNLSAGVPNGLVFRRGTTTTTTSTVTGLCIERFANDGVEILGRGRVNLSRCRIGTDPSGRLAHGNGRDGVNINSGGSTLGWQIGSGNVISGNGRNGVTLAGGTAAVGNNIVGNFIGTDITGATAIANRGDGVLISGGSNYLVGGNVGPWGNTIAFNAGHGVNIQGGAGTVGCDVIGNSIFSNGRLGINLGPGDGVTPNDTGDGDTGVNGQQNFPVISMATLDGGTVTIRFTLNSRPNARYLIQLFASPAADVSGFGEGKRYIGGIEATSDALGNISFSFLKTGLTAGQVITATATSEPAAAASTAVFSTSEFSKAVPITALGSVAGNVFNDVNADGAKNGTDTALANWKVWLDTDRDGVLDPTERTAITDSAGNYKFTGLWPGSYRIREVMPAGWRRTTPKYGYPELNVAAGQNITGYNFGNTQRVLISGTVFNDLNANGKKDSGEAGLSVWRVFIDSDNDGTWDSTEKSVQTDGSGNFSFTTLPAGTYRLRVVQQSGWKRTTPTLNGGSLVITLGSGGTSTGNLFGEKTV